MYKKFKLDGLDMMSLMNGLVFFAPVALLVRTKAGLSTSDFFLLQVVLSVVILGFEIPTGKLTDCVGYRNTIILSQVTLSLARVLLLIAYVSGSFIFFVFEAFVEGISSCFSSGTESAYLYVTTDKDYFVTKSAHVSNCGTIGFIISTVAYAVMYSYVGIAGLIVATIIPSLIGLFATFTLKKEPTVSSKNVKTNSRIDFKDLVNTKIFMIVVILSCVSISYILINFFYVDKLQTLQIREEWMTPVILGYSAVQLLSEKILAHIPEKKYHIAFSFFFLIAGVMMLLFGFSNNLILVIVVMLTLPLMIDLPSFILDEIQNKVIDELDAEEKRAEMLSVFNMGINVVEIVFLLFSALLVNAGITMCFYIMGSLMIFISICGYVYSKSKICI
jgi:MFS family permease